MKKTMIFLHKFLFGVFVLSVLSGCSKFEEPIELTSNDIGLSMEEKNNSGDIPSLLRLNQDAFEESMMEQSYCVDPPFEYCDCDFSVLAICVDSECYEMLYWQLEVHGNGHSSPALNLFWSKYGGGSNNPQLNTWYDANYDLIAGNCYHLYASVYYGGGSGYHVSNTPFFVEIRCDNGSGGYNYRYIELNPWPYNCVLSSSVDLDVPERYRALMVNSACQITSPSANEYSPEVYPCGTAGGGPIGG